MEMSQTLIEVPQLQSNENAELSNYFLCNYSKVMMRSCSYLLLNVSKIILFVIAIPDDNLG